MQFIKRSRRSRPEISFVLLDWSVRESFHLLHYLASQTIERERFEIVVIEYYSRISNAIRKYEDQVDTWLLLEMPQESHYHKHLMYNAGIVVSQGKIIAIGDSDAMVRETFVESIVNAFGEDPGIVLHLDQFRNNRRDLYPFNFPSFEDVMGEGCVNYVGGKTRGLSDAVDPLHSRNYGACMCATRADLIAIGGADEHADYLGHICGPYEMTFRLLNAGRREVWLDNEFTYHTWHPGQAGSGNYLGPHDGRHMSTTALRALLSGRVLPLFENEAIRQMRMRATVGGDVSLEKLIDADRTAQWTKDQRHDAAQAECPELHFVESFWGARIFQEKHRFTAEWITKNPPYNGSDALPLGAHSFSSISEARNTILGHLPFSLKLRIYAFAVLAFIWRCAELSWKAVCRIRRIFSLRPKNITERIGQGIKERLLHSSDVANLIVLLVARSANDIRDTPKVVILGKGDALIMRLLVWLHVLPTARVVEAKDRNSARQIVASVSENDSAVLLSGNAYVRFHSDFAACPRDKVLIV